MNYFNILYTDDSKFKFYSESSFNFKKLIKRKYHFI